VDPEAGKDIAQDIRVVFPLDVVIAPDLDVAGLLRIGVVEFSDPVVDGGVGDIYLLKGLTLCSGIDKVVGIPSFFIMICLLFALLFTSQPSFSKTFTASLPEITGNFAITPLPQWKLVPFFQKSNPYLKLKDNPLWHL